MKPDWLKKCKNLLELIQNSETTLFWVREYYTTSPLSGKEAQYMYMMDNQKEII